MTVGNQQKHDWSRLFKKPVKNVQLRRHVHYDCMTHSMSVMIRQAAKARGYLASVYYATNVDGLLVTTKKIINRGKK